MPSGCIKCSPSRGPLRLPQIGLSERAVGPVGLRCRLPAQTHATDFGTRRAQARLSGDEDGEEFPSAESARAHAVRIANELAQAGEYGGFAIKVLDEQGNEVAYVPIGKRSS
jgi:hypothetical protein